MVGFKQNGVAILPTGSQDDHFFKAIDMPSLRDGMIIEKS